jgi:hypothetical protein
MAAALVGAATSGGAPQGFAAFALLLVTAATIVVSRCSTLYIYIDSKVLFVVDSIDILLIAAVECILPILMLGYLL